MPPQKFKTLVKKRGGPQGGRAIYFRKREMEALEKAACYFISCMETLGPDFEATQGWGEQQANKLKDILNDAIDKL